MCRVLNAFLCCLLNVPFLLLLPEPVRRLPTGMRTETIVALATRAYMNERKSILLCDHHSQNWMCCRHQHWALRLPTVLGLPKLGRSSSPIYARAQQGWRETHRKLRQIQVFMCISKQMRTCMCKRLVIISSCYPQPVGHRCTNAKLALRAGPVGCNTIL